MKNVYIKISLYSYFFSKYLDKIENFLNKKVFFIYLKKLDKKSIFFQFQETFLNFSKKLFIIKKNPYWLKIYQ